MNNDEITSKAVEWLSRHGLDTSGGDFNWYGPFCAVVMHYTHGKLAVGDILQATDKLTDALTNGLPGFTLLPLAFNEEDQILGLIRAMEFLPETKGRLSRDEKEAFAFCVFHIYEICQSPDGTVSDFNSIETIDSIYRRMKDDPAHADWFRKRETSVSGAFGYDPSNPIRALSITSSYFYLRRLRRADGTPHTYRRLGSVDGADGGILDKWQFEFMGHICILFVDCYAEEPSEVAPMGWILADDQEI